MLLARAGAGLVTIICPRLSLWKKLCQLDPLLVYRCFRPYIIARNDLTMLAYIHGGKSKGRVCPVIGPGLGDKEYLAVRSLVLSVLEEGVPVVIDADGLNAFEGHQAGLYGKTHNNVVLTPHEGEFRKLFPDLVSLLENDRVGAASKAALDVKGRYRFEGGGNNYCCSKR